MPQLATRVLKDAEAVDHNYVPTNKNGTVAVFTDRVQPFFANQSTLREETTPVTKNNEGHRLTAALAYPSPVKPVEGCCIDPTQAPVSFIQVKTLANKQATGTELDDMIALFRSYVASAEFAALVKGDNNW